MSAFKNIEVESDSMPVVELDTEAQAAYVRFREGKVVRSQEVETTSAVVTLDLDQADQIIGVELIGVKDFTVYSLLKAAHLEKAVSPEALSRTRYLSATGA
jgi:uncharacterized protein YuzE